MIRRADGDDDLATILGLRYAIEPLTATTVEDMRAFDAQAEAPLRLLAEQDGRAVGLAAAMRFRDEAYADGLLGVVPDRRGRGTGGALLDELSRHVRVQGWPALQLAVREGPDADWLARRPELVPALHALLLEGLHDVPGTLAEEPPTYEGFLDWLRVPSRLPEFAVIALVGGEPAGFAQLNVYPRIGYHGFTTVARPHRSRGIARALKLELIRRAREHGLERLITQSNEDNRPMRTLNASLGYEPAPTLVFMRRAVD